MRYLKTYQLFESKTGLTKEQEEFLNKYTKGSWKYNPATGLVDVEGDFECQERSLSTLYGVKFGQVSGSFNCYDNTLTSLEGAPQEIRGDFDCRFNKFTSLQGAPQKVGGDFYCEGNQLTTLKGAPQEVGGSLYCRNNQLTTLEGAPQEVGGSFVCSENKLTSLEGAPQKIGGRFLCSSFELEQGEWNLEGWLSVLKEGSPEAQQLIATILSPEVLNKEIRKDPTGMIMKLKEVWNDESFRETRSKLVWPRGYEKKASLLGDLDDVGF